MLRQWVQCCYLGFSLNNQVCAEKCRLIRGQEFVDIEYSRKKLLLWKLCRYRITQWKALITRQWHCFPEIVWQWCGNGVVTKKTVYNLSPPKWSKSYLFQFIFVIYSECNTFKTNSRDISQHQPTQFWPTIWLPEWLIQFGPTDSE